MDVAAVESCSLVEAYVKELRTLARPQDFTTDIREQRFVSRTLQMAVTASLNAALHSVVGQNLGWPSRPGEVFSILASRGWIPAETADALRNLTRLRHAMIYDDPTSVPLENIYRAVTENLDDLLAFAAALRERLGSA